VAFAAALEVSSQQLAAIPADSNARVTASVPPGSTVASARVYFNAVGKKPEYYVEMVPAGEGKYWAMLPVPKSETKSVDYRIVFRDSDGKPFQSPQMNTPVKSSAKVEPTEVETKYAKNLVIGVTDPEAPLMPEGFQCVGVISSINIRGELKPNEVCRNVIVPPLAWVAAGAAAGTIGVIVVEQPPDAPPPVSPAFPSSQPAAPKR
jgi:hypothetical protein